ncbi:low molecular weight phosphatase family protein [Micromonospora sp. M12]
MAEYLARRLLADRPVTVASAGTDAVDGLGMHPYAMEVATESGADPAEFRTRGLRAEYLVEATLVLTATRRQRSVCTALAPGALHRTFTLRQFGRLAAAAEPPEGSTDDSLGRRSPPPHRPGTAATRRPGRGRPPGPDRRDRCRLPALRGGDRTVAAALAALIGATE